MLDLILWQRIYGYSKVSHQLFLVLALISEKYEKI